MAYTYAQLKTAIQEYTENTETAFVSNIDDFIRAAEDRLFYLVDLEYFRKNATSAATSGNAFLLLPTDFLASFSLSITNGSNKEFLLQKDVNFIQEFNPNSATTGTPKYYARFDVDNMILAPTPDSNYVCEFHYFYRPTSLVDEQISLTVNSVSGTFTAGEYVQGATSETIAQIASTDISGSTGTIKLIPKTFSGTGFLGANVGVGSSRGSTETINGLESSASATTSQVINPLTWLSENAPNALLYGSLYEAYIYMKGEPDMLQLYDKQFTEAVTRLKDLAEARENADAYRRGLPDRPRT